MTANAYEPAMARVQKPGAFAFTGTVPQSPRLFLIILNAMDEPLAWPLRAAQAMQIHALYPSGSIAATKMRCVDEEGYAAMLALMQKDVLERLAPTGEFKLVLSHLAIDNVGDAAMLPLRPTNNVEIDSTLTFGSLLVLLSSIHEGGVITLLDHVDRVGANHRRVALVFRLVYDDEHEDMRLAPPDQEPAIAAFTALAQSPFERIQRIGKPILYPPCGRPLAFEQLAHSDKALVHFLLSTTCFDVALAACYAHYEESDDRIRDVVLGVLCHDRALDYRFDDGIGVTRSRHAIVFWPKHHRVALADRDTVLADLAAALLRLPHDDTDPATPLAHSVLGIPDLDDALQAAMMTFSAQQSLHRRCRLDHGRTTPLAIMVRLLAQQRDLHLTICFVADIVTIQDDVPACELALWLHGLLTRHGWGPFQPALLQLVTRWTHRNVEDVLHLLASLVGVDDAPLCPPLRQPHEAELLKRCYAALLAVPYSGSCTQRRSDMVKHHLLLEAYVTTTAPQRACANYFGCILPPALVSAVDAFLLPSPPPFASWILNRWGFHVYSDIAVGLAAAVQRDPTLWRSPLVAHVLDTVRSDASTRLDAAGGDAASSLLVLALHEKRLDDAMFDTLVKAFGAGLLPGMRSIAGKQPHLLSSGFGSQVVVYVFELVPVFGVMARTEKKPSRHLLGTREAPTLHQLVHDAIELLRLFAPTQLPSFIGAWLQHLPNSLRVTDTVLLPVAHLVLHDAPLCRHLLHVAATRSSRFEAVTQAMNEAKEAIVVRILATIADLEMQMDHDEIASTLKRPRRE